MTEIIVTVAGVRFDAKDTYDTFVSPKLSAGGYLVPFRRGEPIFAQGDVCEHVWYIQSGGIKLSVLSKTGKEAVVAMLGPGDFFGEGCLAGQELRMGSATAVTVFSLE